MTSFLVTFVSFILFLLCLYERAAKKPSPLPLLPEKKKQKRKDEESTVMKNALERGAEAPPLIISPFLFFFMFFGGSLFHTWTLTCEKATRRKKSKRR